MNIKKIGITTVAITIMFSGVALAAQSNIVPVETQQPYVVANRPADGMISFNITGTAIVSEAFVVAQTIPLHASAIANRDMTVTRTMYVTSTGYNSLPEQTDSTPFIAADGTHVYDGMVAANFLKFGTKIKIPELYGDKIFTVHDRMHPRFDNRVDVWFEHKSDALQWGRRTVKIEILG